MRADMMLRDAFSAARRGGRARDAEPSMKRSGKLLSIGIGATTPGSLGAAWTGRAPTIVDETALERRQVRARSQLNDVSEMRREPHPFS